MEKEDNKKAGKEANKRGHDFETFVAEVFNYYQRLHKDRKDFIIQKNYYNFFVSKNEICDVYFSYKDDNDKIIYTFVQCKSGNFTYDNINYQCIGHYANLKSKFEKQGIDIEKARKILCYQEEDQMTEEIKKLCKTHNIELKRIIMDSGLVEIKIYAYRQFILTFKVVKRDNGNFLDFQLPVEAMPCGKDNNDKPIFVFYNRKAIEEYIDKNKSSLITDEKIYAFFKPITDKFLFDKLEPKFQKGIMLSKEMKTNFKLFELPKEKDDENMKFLLICKYISILKDDGSMSLEFKTENKTEQLCYIRKPLEN